MNFKEIQQKIMGDILPAVPVPVLENGEIHLESQRNYVKWMNEQPVNAVAIWAHTGRGLKLSKEQRAVVFNEWRNGLDDEKIILCGVGANIKDGIKDEDYIKEAVDMAYEAKDLGADLIMPYAPTLFRGREDQDEMILKYHKEIAKVGLPMVAFFLYEAAGGVNYSLDLLRELFKIENVIAIKMATLDSVMTYQNVSNMIKEENLDIALITGEDRMFGYTLMRGAKGALIGLSSIYTKLQKDMLNSYFIGDYKSFIEKSELVDNLAEHTFYAPMEGYIERVLYILAQKGIISKEAVNDPYGPGVKESERVRIDQFISKLGDM
ncbi:dihydrodipicolinate synthase family protein [Clostridium polynesiense]|uniref:dihydrodipicolinate synthase family protein n=1 Tax=Clostridium polynesiense TaxID=1325933 RepID=UPI000590C284|nr:dihydrodipicolinate synthase family protein [Clostridium polynesiense]